MLKAITKSANIIFDNKGRVIHSIQPCEIKAMTEKTPQLISVPFTHSYSTSFLKKLSDQIEPDEYHDFETNLKTKQEWLNITQKDCWDKIISKEIDNLNNPGYHPELNDTPVFSAVKFQAGRAQLMSHNILKSIIRHHNNHFDPELLIQISNENYNFNTHFNKQKMENIYQFREYQVKWVKETFDNIIMHRPFIRTEKEKEWKPTHFLEMRTRTLKHIAEVDKYVLQLIERKVACVLGPFNDQDVLTYCRCIFQLHVVEEFKFCPIIHKHAMRLRLCLDASVLNDATVPIQFKLITGAELTLALTDTNSFVSFDNKASFHSTRLGPSCTPYLAFRWRGLIIGFLAPPFGTTNSPSINETLMHAFHLETKFWLKNVPEQDRIQFSLSWIDDSLISSKIIPIGESPIRIVKLLALIFMKFGLTLNVQKSEVRLTQQIDYLGLTLNAKNKTFAVQTKLINDIISLLIDKLNITCPELKQLMLHKNYITKGITWLHKNYKFKTSNFHLTFKIIEKYIGKITWCNRNYTLDSEIYATIILYRHKLSWSSVSIINKALEQMFNTPYLLAKYLAKPQPIKPVTACFYTSITDIFTPNVKTQNDWQGLKPILFNEIISNKSKQPWMRNPSKLTNIVNEHSEWCYKNFNIEGNFQKGELIWQIWIIDSPQLMFTTWQDNYAKNFEALNLIKNKIQSNWSIAVQFKFIKKNPTPPNPHHNVFPLKITSTDTLLTHCPPHKITTFPISRSLSFTPTSLTDSNICFFAFQGIEFWNKIKPNTNRLIINNDDPNLFVKFSNLLKTRPQNMEVIWIFQSKKRHRLAQAITLAMDPFSSSIDKTDWKTTSNCKIINIPTAQLWALGFGVKTKNWRI